MGQSIKIATRFPIHKTKLNQKDEVISAVLPTPILFSIKMVKTEKGFLGMGKLALTKNPQQELLGGYATHFYIKQQSANSLLP